MNCAQEVFKQVVTCSLAIKMPIQRTKFAEVVPSSVQLDKTTPTINKSTFTR
jgi:hypothetical protein